MVAMKTTKTTDQHGRAHKSAHGVYLCSALDYCTGKYIGKYGKVMDRGVGMWQQPLVYTLVMTA